MGLAAEWPVKGNWAPRTPIVCRVSEDNGASWGEEVVLDHEENPAEKRDGEFSYPAVVARGKEIHVTYTWKRRSIRYCRLSL